MYATDVCRPSIASPMDKVLPIVMALALMLAPLAFHPLFAQGLESEEAIDAIVGSDVKTEQTTKEAQADRVLKAINNTLPTAEEVRKAFNVDTLEIVYLPDVGQENGAIEQAITKREPEIEALRESIEGSAMFYHAVDSRGILLRDIVAVEFGESNSATIFVNAEEQ